MKFRWTNAWFLLRDSLERRRFAALPPVVFVAFFFLLLALAARLFVGRVNVLVELVGDAAFAVLICIGVVDFGVAVFVVALCGADDAGQRDREERAHGFQRGDVGVDEALGRVAEEHDD